MLNQQEKLVGIGFKQKKISELNFNLNSKNLPKKVSVKQWENVTLLR